MHNTELARDYILRSTARLRAVEVLFEAESWADVVRESQELVELALKALLRSVGVDPPRIHDVSDVLEAEAHRLPDCLRGELATLTRISRDLRRDRELSFYGAEDLTPSGFYTRDDGERARRDARTIVERVRPHIK